MFFKGNAEQAGRWNDVACSEMRGYICEIKVENQYPEQDNSYWDNCPVNEHLSNQGFVSKTVMGETHSCYYHVKDAETFSVAEEHCRNLGTDVHLLSIQDTGLYRGAKF